MLIRDAEQAAAFLESVHNLHDAFISRFTLTSRDRFEIEEAQEPGGTSLICAGEVEIRFEQDPGIDGPPARRRQTIILFREVADVHLDLRGVRAPDWALHEVRMKSDGQAGRLSLICIWDRCTSDGEWRRHEAVLFTFAECEVQ